jgi:hypothetical protein
MGLRSTPAAGTALGRDGGEETIPLGDTPVLLVSTAREPAGLTYVSVHENEHTAVTAVRQFVARRGGRVVELRAQRHRLVTFSRAGVHYTFDPNRIFTPAGVEKTLRRYGPYTPLAHADVARLATALFDRIRSGLLPPLVAVHNNSEGALSVESYRPGGSLETEAAEVWVNRAMDPDDFLLVTERGLFDRLRTLEFNVVLQSATPSDDGSLSVYCQGRLPYVNVEAQFGHLAEQIRMLEAVHVLGASRAR